VKDITERLRDRRMLATAGRIGYGHQNATNTWLTTAPEPDCQEAADEIDRLRSELAAAVEREREECAKVCEALRDSHIQGTRLDSNPGNWCAEDGADCEFVAAWNNAADAIRARSALQSPRT
jgi:hypothetical protein